jgi:hypothetical protein
MEEAQARIQQWLKVGNKQARLDLSNLDLTELPEIPETVIDLNCSSNKLHELKGLPRGLLRLACGGNYLETIQGLPEGLIYLWSFGCRTKTIENLPNSIRYLNLDFNQELIRIINLPSDLRYLHLFSTLRLQYICTFPPKLRSLVIEGADIEILDSFPETLKRIELIQCNHLGIIPKLPLHLKVFKIYSQIKNQSINIPPNLLILDIDGTNTIEPLINIPSSLIYFENHENYENIIPSFNLYPFRRYFKVRER